MFGKRDATFVIALVYLISRAEGSGRAAKRLTRAVCSSGRDSPVWKINSHLGEVTL